MKVTIRSGGNTSRVSSFNLLPATERAGQTKLAASVRATLARRWSPPWVANPSRWQHSPKLS